MVTFKEVPDTVLNIYLEEIDGLKKVTAT